MFSMAASVSQEEFPNQTVLSVLTLPFKYPWVLRPPIEFATVEELLARMPSEVIASAEKRRQARQKLLDELFKKA
jgi:hypothetical protein